MRRSLLLFADTVAARLLFPLVVLLTKLRRQERFEDPVQPGRTPRFLVIRPGGIGDGIMAVPLLRVLRQRFPGAVITLVCVSKNRRALEHLPYVDELMVVDLARELPRHLLRLMRERYDVVLDLEPFRYLSAIVAVLSGAPVRVGFDTNRRRDVFSHLVTYVHDRCSETRNMVRQLSVLGIKPSDEECADLSFEIPERHLSAAREILLAHGLEPARCFPVAVAPGVLKPHHRWVMSEFARLIEKVYEEDAAARVVLVGDAGDAADAREVLALLPDRQRVVDLVGRTSFMEALGVLRACRILVACDGGIVYMAAAMGCATVSLWGPGVMERFKPAGARHLGVRKGFSCIPCVTWERLGKFPGCPYQRRCYNELTAEEVLEPYVRLKRTLAAPASPCGRVADQVSASAAAAPAERPPRG